MSKYCSLDYSEELANGFMRFKDLRKTQIQQNVGDYLSAAWWSYFQVITLPDLLAITLVTAEIWIFESVTWPHVSHEINQSCDFKDGRLLTVSQQFA